ncbi:LysR family transcriptional regulator [Aliamphritea spongicola]|uniref:LysR family transcriptional regulator n=1 Tax=Aliamphritea spongicola TaxID=707589 RepID=UPI00196A37D8|nr:LysR family transcriptional regulator [Aliamphritea spongicola]MBN3561052.1 LysR family transcriptional regulator [Aliamphritea spongicola]
MPDINDMLIFAKVAELQGISPAARALNLPKSKVSRRMAMLEASLGARLLERTTRAVHLTEAGRIYYQHCKQINEAVENAEHAVQQLSETPRGQLRISASVTTGQKLIAPHLSEFAELYPLVNIDLDLSNRRVDVVSEGFDLVVRVGKLEDSNLISRKLGGGSAGLFAAPDYLKKHGTPADPEALHEHRILVMSDASNVLNWRLQNNRGEAHTLNVTPSMKINDMTTLTTVVAGGAGIACLPAYLVHEQVASGQLCRVLPDWHTPEINLYILYPSQRGLTHKARLWMDFYISKLADNW